MQELIEALTTLTSTLNAVLVKEHEQSDDGESAWDAVWYVFSAERGEVEYKSEEAARMGGRYWVEQSDRPALVDVYCRERQTRLYRRAPLDRASWLNAESVSA